MNLPPPSSFTSPPALFGEGWHVVRAADRGQGWHPQVRALLCHWLRLCTAEGHVPARNIIDRSLLGDLLPYCWMLDVERTPSWRFRYRMAGSAFVDAIGQDLTNHWYDEARPLAWAANRLRLITTARDGVPTWRRGPIPVEDDALDYNGWRESENLMLPLAFDGINTDTLLGISLPYRPIEVWGTAEAAD